MRLGILGPVEIRTADGTPVDPGGSRPRALLTLLLLDAGRTVLAARPADGLYGAEPPAGAAHALQSQISRLRRRLFPHAEIEATPHGYRLAVPPEQVDVHRFKHLIEESRRARTAGDDPARAAALLRDALALWRGPDLPDAHTERARPHRAAAGRRAPCRTASRPTSPSAAGPSWCPSCGRCSPSSP
ncbi:BTAD domain-containing putative transcriptional regulator [Streptomyces longwoodensis]|uniref:AfsR/SARP family transcriptional regulator n=1 Tax=Streptomyces longwoodensis TaxID=68231 RepID=UPI0033C3925C